MRDVSRRLFIAGSAASATGFVFANGSDHAAASAGASTAGPAYAAERAEVVSIDGRVVMAASETLQVSVPLDGFPEDWEVLVGDEVMLVELAGVRSAQPLVHVDRSDPGTARVRGRHGNRIIWVD